MFCDKDLTRGYLKAPVFNGSHRCFGLLLGEEGLYGFFFDAGKKTELFDGDKTSAGLTALFSYLAQQPAGGFEGKARDVGNVFGVNDDTVRNGIHKQGFSLQMGWHFNGGKSTVDHRTGFIVLVRNETKIINVIVSIGAK